MNSYISRLVVVDYLQVCSNCFYQQCIKGLSAAILFRPFSIKTQKKSMGVISEFSGTLELTIMD